MKKDIVIALIIGFLLGGLASLLLINLPSILKRTPPSQTPATTTPTPALSLPPASLLPTLEINTPSDESLSKTKNVKVSGKTTVKSTILVETDFDAKITEASADGSFSVPLNLTDGENNILVTVYNEKGEEETKTLKVFYTEEKL